MAEYIWKHLPYAVYLDTNALRSAGHSLSKPWINDLLSVTNEYGISLCISKLVVEEWCEHILEVLLNNRRKMLSSIEILKDYDIQVPSIQPQDIGIPQKPSLLELVHQRLSSIGFTIISDWDAPLSSLLRDAVQKTPPFEQGGKGLCDAVILESYVQHARQNSMNRVLVISNDAAVRRSKNRFEKGGIAVDFVRESEIVSKLKSSLRDETATYLEEERARLREYVLTHESEILNYVKKTPLTITDQLLNPLFTEEKDRISGSIEKILLIRPVEISFVFGGTPPYGEDVLEGRYSVQIFVQIELEVVVSELDWGFTRPRAIVQPETLENAPVTIESTDWQRQQTTQTVKRNVTVYATLDAEKEKRDILEDFRIEKIA